MMDVCIVGGGPAGLSAAVTAKARGAECLIVSNDIASNPLAKSARVDNMIGMRGMSGLQMLQKMKDDAEAAGVPFRQGRVLSVAAVGDRFMLSVGDDIVEAKRVIVATGVRAPKKLPGEEQFLGRGVSYCATCDGMLYRGKTAIVTGDADELAEEAALLQRIGVQVTVVNKERPQGLPEDVPFIQASSLSIEEGDPLLLKADEQSLSTHVVFVLRREMAMDTLVPGLAMNGRFVAVDDHGETNIPGMYAAGDCIGPPLQIAKAVGDGLKAAWYATASLP